MLQGNWKRKRITPVLNETLFFDVENKTGKAINILVPATHQ